MAFKPPVNFRSVASRTPTPEAFVIEGGIGLLAEAPADPSQPSFPMVVVVEGMPYTRVTGTPTLYQYRVKTQLVVGADGQSYSEYLPILEFDDSVVSDGFSGTADYWRAGTVLTSEWFSTLISFLTPIVGISSPTILNNLYPPTTNPLIRGRVGDIAVLTDGTMQFSDGTKWNQVSGTGAAQLGAALTVAQAMSLAIDSGYVGPSFTTSDTLAAANLTLTQDALWQGFSSWVGDPPNLAVAASLTMDAVVAAVGATSFGGTLSMTQDGTFATDSIAPDISTFTASGTSSPVTISFSASDNVGVTGWMIKETATNSAPTAPASGDAGWLGSAPTSFTTASTGTIYLWGYAKDAAGNVAAFGTGRSVTISAASGITLVGATYSERDGAGTGNLVATLPGGIQSGDIIVLTDDAGTGTAPSGYTVKAQTANLSQVSWKRAGSSESNPTVVSSTDYHAVVCAVFRGCVASGDPFEVTGYDAGGTTNPDTIAAITTLTNGACVLAVARADDAGWDDSVDTGPNTSVHLATPSGYTVCAEGDHVHLGNASAWRASLGAWYKIQASAGSTGSVQFGATVTEAWPGYSVGSNVGEMRLLALKPA